MMPSYLLQKEGVSTPQNSKLTESGDFPTLYARTKTGNIKWYVIKVKHFEVYSEIHRIYASKLGGKSQKDINEIHSGVNIGKANETTIRQQAELVAESMYKKRLDEGYKTAEDLGLVINTMTGEYTINEISNNTDATGKLKPMLAEEGENLYAFPCGAQPKFDGLRCLSIRHKDYVELYSRQGKRLYNKRIEKYLMGALKEGEMLDGELYLHGKPLQYIASIVKREKTEHPDADKLNYVVYDCPILEVTWDKRFIKLQSYKLPDFSTSKDNKNPVMISPTYNCPTKSVLETYHKKFRKDGFEGTIIRLYDGLYEAGFRSRKLIKKKEYDTDEFEIIGVNEATGRDKRTAIFVCKTKEGKEFNCRPMGTREVRSNYWLARKTFIGKMLTVEFRGYTPDKIPFQPVGVVVRDYE